MIDDKLCMEAIQRIARTDDGRLLYLKLQKVVMGLPTEMKSGALRVNFGRRSLAHELMAAMADGLSENTSARDADRPIVFTLAKSVAVSGARGARRRVSADPGSSGIDDTASDS